MDRCGPLFPDAMRLRKLGLSRRPDTLHGAEMSEQHLRGVRPHTGNVCQRGGNGPFRPE